MKERKERMTVKRNRQPSQKKLSFRVGLVVSSLFVRVIFSPHPVSNVSSIFSFLLADNEGTLSSSTGTRAAKDSSSYSMLAEAVFVAAVSAAKNKSLLCYILIPPAPILVYKDNMSTINMINYIVPTERSRHIDIQMFAIQSWAQEFKAILLAHISGTINPASPWGGSSMPVTSAVS